MCVHGSFCVCVRARVRACVSARARVCVWGRMCQCVGVCVYRNCDFWECELVEDLCNHMTTLYSQVIDVV